MYTYVNTYTYFVCVHVCGYLFACVSAVSETMSGSSSESDSDVDAELPWPEDVDLVECFRTKRFCRGVAKGENIRNVLKSWRRGQHSGPLAVRPLCVSVTVSCDCGEEMTTNLQ